MEMDEQLLTVKELSEYLKLSRPETYKLLASNEIAHFRVGKKRGAIRIRVSDVTAFLNDRMRGPTRAAQQQPTFRALKHIKRRH